jgi:hypothetical protein
MVLLVLTSLCNTEPHGPPLRWHGPFVLHEGRLLFITAPRCKAAGFAFIGAEQMDQARVLGDAFSIALLSLVCTVRYRFSR